MVNDPHGQPYHHGSHGCAGYEKHYSIEHIMLHGSANKLQANKCSACQHIYLESITPRIALPVQIEGITSFV